MLSEFNGIGPELMPKFGVGRLVFGGGVVFLGGGVAVWRRGGGGRGWGVSLGGGGRAFCVLFVMFFYV